MLAVLPFYHIYGMVAVLHTTLWCGATIVTMPAFDPEGFLGAVEEHKVSYLPVAPPLASNNSPIRFVFGRLSRTLMGCADPPSKGVGAPLQCPLGSVASYLVYADVRTFR